MVTDQTTSHVVGLWQGASYAVQVCPYCPSIVMEESFEEFKAKLGKKSPEDHRPICPICYGVGFVYLEHSGEREWFRQGARHSFRFLGWDDAIFMQKIGLIYRSDTSAYRNIKHLADTGF